MSDFKYRRCDFSEKHASGWLETLPDHGVTLLTMKAPPTPAAREPTALMRKVLNQLVRLKELRGMGHEEIANKGGAGQQAWSKWERGSSPQVDTLQDTAAALDADLVIEIVDRRATSGPRLSEALTAEAVEIVAIVDSIPDQETRVQICTAVHRLARTLRLQ